MLTREEIASLMADEEISDAAIACMVDPEAMLAELASEVGDGPDKEAREEMVRELRAMMVQR